MLSGAAPGNPGVLYSDGVYNTELELIKNHRGPIVGICLGMELIAHAYDMHLHRQKRRIHRLLAYSFTLKFAMERIMAKRYSSSY